MDQNIIFSIKKISKFFPGVKALEQVSFDIRKGEVHAIVGENGAGKSTLMNILSGVYEPSGGTLVYEGREVQLKSARFAQDIGIAMIHQELSLSPALSIAENIFVGRLPKRRSGFLDLKKMYEDTKAALKEVGLHDLEPSELIRNINASHQQLVEIAKALALHSKIMIMDEPTSSLTKSETEYLFKIIDSLKSRGVTILYISHKLDEIMELSDTITVLRDGQHIITGKKEHMTIGKMISHMVGRQYRVEKIREVFIEDYSNKEVLLEAAGLTAGNKVRGISFKLYKGEVLGITGLVGSGRSELLQAVYGADRYNKGVIKIDGRECIIKNPDDAIREGIALLPEGRITQGLFLRLSIQDNVTMLYLKNLRTKLRLFLKMKQCRKITREYIDKLRIKTPSSEQLVENLSGGNQQKVILARCLMNKPKILLMDEPTQGIDIGAKEEIYHLIDQLVQSGVSVIMVSSEMQETISLCDRVLVMHEGKITGELMHADVTDEKILKYASGGE